MADMLARDTAWLAGQRKRFIGTSVVYRRGASSATLTATIGSTKRELDEGDGLVTRYESRDFLITAADLILGGARVMPQPGDQIVEADGSVCELMDFPGDGYWTWSGPYRVTLRVHTKQVFA